ncbi:MAG: hypothetical protein K0R54_678 [Clostridiaceae bacterium]|jgi:hypothetical protein|nr:hypothetical protein [Clostridiaceae bacterium]
MNKIDIKEFANSLNNREYGNELTKEEIEIAKELGYVIVFGFSDDCTEFEGAIYDEVGSYGNVEIYIEKDGIIKECECECKYFMRAKEKAKIIKVLHDRSFVFKYETTIPHETFYIYCEGNKYCEGIVFDIKDL